MRPSYRQRLAVSREARLPSRQPWISSSVAPSNTGVIGLEAELRAGPAQVRFENLAHVHAARHAQRVEQDVDRRAVRQERHVLFGQDLGDDALVAVAAGHLVADRDQPLGGDVDLDHLLHAAGQLVAALQRVELAVACVDRFFDARPELLVSLLGVLLASAGCECPGRRS